MSISAKLMAFAVGSALCASPALASSTAVTGHVIWYANARPGTNPGLFCLLVTIQPSGGSSFPDDPANTYAIGQGGVPLGVVGATFYQGTLTTVAGALAGNSDFEAVSDGSTTTNCGANGSDHVSPYKTIMPTRMNVTH